MEGPACADTGARTPIGVGGNFILVVGIKLCPFYNFRHKDSEMCFLRWTEKEISKYSDSISGGKVTVLNGVNIKIFCCGLDF